MENQLVNSGETETFSFYVGTYTENNGSKGIYHCEVAVKTGSFRILGTGDFVDNPSYLALSPEREVLYAVLETATYRGIAGGGIAAFDISPAGIRLRQTVSSGGSFPCHISLDNAGRHLFAANYGDGVFSVFDLTTAAGLLPRESFAHQEMAAGKAPHAHFAVMAPEGKYLCVVDLGLDAIVVYTYEELTGAVAYYGRCEVAPGSGPRHLVFSADGKNAYAVHELSSEVEVFDYAAGRLVSRQKLSTLPDGFTGNNNSAAIRLSPDGRFLYASNRGDDSIAVYRVVREKGELTYVGAYSCGGRSPRDFALLNAHYLLVANQESGTVTLLYADEDGRLSPVGEAFAIPGAVCVLPDR